MGETDGQVCHAEFPGPRARPPVEMHQRGVAPVGQDLDIAPGYTPSAGTQRLHDRLLAGESDRQFRGSTTAEVQLRLGIDPREKPLTPAINRRPNSVNLYYVNTNLMHGYQDRLGEVSWQEYITTVGARRAVPLHMLTPTALVWYTSREDYRATRERRASTQSRGGRDADEGKRYRIPSALPGAGPG